LAVIYVENILKLESGAIGEFVRSTVLMGLMDMLIEFDVSILNFPNKLMAKKV
jgi:RNA polymerase I-specific transcription initiation factor RRN3